MVKPAFSWGLISALASHIAGAYSSPVLNDVDSVGATVDFFDSAPLLHDASSILNHDDTALYAEPPYIIESPSEGIIIGQDEVEVPGYSGPAAPPTVPPTTSSSSPNEVSDQSTRRTPRSRCSVADVRKSNTRFWAIVVERNQLMDRNCGRGFLDNFRDKCGEIMKWSCENIEHLSSGDVEFAAGTVWIRFFSSKNCSPMLGEDLIRIASHGWLDVRCELFASTDDLAYPLHPDEYRRTGVGWKLPGEW